MKKPSRPAIACLVLLAAALPAAAQEEPLRRPSTIAVSGVGEIGAAPDTADIDAGVTSEAPTAARALADNSAAVGELLATLRQAGVAARDLQTSSFNVQPVYEMYREGERRPPRVVGYRVSNQIHVRVRELDALGGILDAVVQSGATDVGGIRFSVAEPAALLDEARRLAVRDARRKAVLLATEAGLRLGSVLEIREGGASPDPMPKMALMEARADVPIASGEETLRAAVEMVYELVEEASP